MNKTKFFKALGLAMCAILLVIGSVAGTFAYLTSQTDPITNTFTAGNVKITMDETKIDTDGITATGTRVNDANSYKLLPGRTYTKDPTIHVDDASEDCWLFVKITDELAAIQDTDTIAAQLASKGWTLVTGTANVYARDAANTAGDDVVVFETFKVKDDVDNATLATYAGKTIVVTAYAIQADGFADAAVAWDAAPAAWKS